MSNECMSCSALFLQLMVSELMPNCRKQLLYVYALAMSRTHSKTNQFITLFGLFNGLSQSYKTANIYLSDMK